MLYLESEFVSLAFKLRPSDALNWSPVFEYSAENQELHARLLNLSSTSGPARYGTVEPSCIQ